MRSPLSIAVPLPFVLLLLLLLSTPSVALTSHAKTRRILRCLGHSASSRADHAKVQALLESNPSPQDGNAWLALSPNTWGFKSHTLPGSDTWTPANGWAKTAKDRLDRQHKKLLACANLVSQAQDTNSAPKPKRQNGAVVVGPNDARGIAMDDVQETQLGLRQGSDDQQKSTGSAASDPGERDAEVAVDAQTPPQGQASVAPPGSDQNPTPGTGGAPANTPSPANGQKTDPASPGNKAPPGVGPDIESVAPTLEDDPKAKFIPKTSAQAVASDPNSVTIGSFSPNVTRDALAVALEAENKKLGFADNGQAGALRQIKLALGPNDANDAAGTKVTNTGCVKLRIRKEYSSLSREEKKAFADAIKCVRQKPSRFKTDAHWNRADDWTLLHIRMVKYVHFTAYFTVFHRGFTAVVERDLNECGFALGLPWVDWTKTAQDPSTNAVFDADREYGLGTNGQGDNNDCPWGTGLAVTDGALADHYFNAPFRHRLCRQFNNMDVKEPNPHFGSNCTTFINANFVRGLGATHGSGKFFDFSSALEISSHLSMHTCIGGNLAWLTSSPNDSLFNVHHATIDNIFDAWQNKDDKNKLAFHGPKLQENHGQHPPWTATKDDLINFTPLAENVKVLDLLDHQSGAWGGRMCYKYDYNVDM